jgi:hypothetical protein
MILIMKKTNHIILFIVLVLSLTACDKEQNQWKQPVDVEITMDVKRTTTASNPLSFDSGELVLADFSIEGERLQAEGVSFSKEFAQGLRIPFDPNTGIAELDFEIPQGTYSSIAVTFSTYDDLAQPNIVLEGIYTNSSAVDVPFRFEFMSSEEFSIVAEDDTGANSIVLNKDVPSKGNIRLDPFYWFDLISTSRLDNAVLSNVDGVQTLLINDQVNTDIYDDVADRIDEQTEMLFEAL